MTQEAAPRGEALLPNSVNLNPMGVGWDYLPFGLLCDIGFSVEPGQRASFRDVTIRNSRSPNNVLFNERRVRRGLQRDLRGRDGLGVVDR